MDVVSVEGLTVEKQVFGAVTRESDDFNGYPSDGLLGMAFGSIAQSKQPTFFEKLIEGKKLAAPLFSVHLTRNRAEGSEVRFSPLERGLESFINKSFTRCALVAMTRRKRLERSLGSRSNRRFVLITCGISALTDIAQTYWSIVMDAIMIDASASVQTNIIAVGTITVLHVESSHPCPGH